MHPNSKDITSTRFGRLVVMHERTNVVLEYAGERHPVAEWSRKTGIQATTILYRIHNGWSHEEALTRPILSKKERLAQKKETNDRNT